LNIMLSMKALAACAAKGVTAKSVEVEVGHTNGESQPLPSAIVDISYPLDLIRDCFCHVLLVFHDPIGRHELGKQ